MTAPVIATDADDRSVAAARWIFDLIEAGVDVSSLEETHTLVARIQEVRREGARLGRDADDVASSHRARVAGIVSGRDTDTDGDAQIEALRAEAAAHGDAADVLEGQVFSSIRARWPEHIANLRAAYVKAAKRMVVLRKTLGAERYSLEDAARRGTAKEWIEQDELFARVSTIRRIHHQWTVDGILPKTGARTNRNSRTFWDDYSPAEFYYEDRAVADVGRNADREMFGQANLFEAAGAALRSIPDVDASWPRSLAHQHQSAEMGRALGGKPVAWDAAQEQARAKYLQATRIGSVFQ